MSYIEQIKQYTGSDLDQIFFRPMLTGPSVQDLGVRVLYNMPVPTKVYLWEAQPNILKPYGQGGWTGGAPARKYEKLIEMHRVKAELAFSAADYFSMVYEKIAARADVNMDDLTGTELEEAETALFRQALTESIRAMMWLGNTEATEFNTFDGFLKTVVESARDDEGLFYSTTYDPATLSNSNNIITLLNKLWHNSPAELRAQKDSGQLAFFATEDICESYARYLDTLGVEAAYTGLVSDHPTLAYRGIPLIDIHVDGYLRNNSLIGMPQSFCIFTDRRNLVMAVNTADFPGNEVRMWYNPDAMENRQRAVFMIGCDVLDEHQIAFAFAE